jgi:hypothetical protein
MFDLDGVVIVFNRASGDIMNNRRWSAAQPPDTNLSSLLQAALTAALSDFVMIWFSSCRPCGVLGLWRGKRPTVALRSTTGYS